MRSCTLHKPDVAGPIDFRHAFLDMTNIQVKEGPHTRAGRTCPAAMGFSFAAGTTDGQPALVVFFTICFCAILYALAWLCFACVLTSLQCCCTA